MFKLRTELVALVSVVLRSADDRLWTLRASTPTREACRSQMRNRMTLEQFVKNNRRINDGADMPREYLEAIFEDVRRNELKVREDNFNKAKCAYMNTITRIYAPAFTSTYACAHRQARTHLCVLIVAGAVKEPAHLTD
eukprot:5008841-Pleurochrysis_carterae.AAC.7